MPCKLTASERAEFADRNARAVDELRKLEAEKKQTAAFLGQQIKDKRIEVNELCDCTLTGIEYREVTIYDDIDKAKGICFTRRSDTDEVLETRRLTPQELQITMDELY